MALAETLPGPFDPQPDIEAICGFAGRHGLSYALAAGLFRMARGLEFGIRIISGARTRAQQAEHQLDFDRSTHSNEDRLGCPRLATGADLDPIIGVTNIVKARMGVEALAAGLRWGGGAPIDDIGIPVDPEWRHVDLGAR